MPDDSGSVDIPSPAPNKPTGPRRSRRLAWVVAGLILSCAAVAFTALAVRSCSRDVAKIFQRETETRLYEYCSSISSESKLILASRSSGFVIPREFAKKLILGLKSTAAIQIGCQATVYFTLDLSDLRSARYELRGRLLTIYAPRPKPMRPLIETASIKKAILDRGLAFNERAELEILQGQLSDLVSRSAESGIDQSILDSCSASLKDIASKALAGRGRRPAEIAVEWVD
jgi:hypothetical protein